MLLTSNNFYQSTYILDNGYLVTVDIINVKENKYTLTCEGIKYIQKRAYNFTTIIDNISFSDCFKIIDEIEKGAI